MKQMKYNNFKRRKDMKTTIVNKSIRFVLVLSTALMILGLFAGQALAADTKAEAIESVKSKINEAINSDNMTLEEAIKKVTTEGVLAGDTAQLQIVIETATSMAIGKNMEATYVANLLLKTSIAVGKDMGLNDVVKSVAAGITAGAVGAGMEALKAVSGQIVETAVSNTLDVSAIVQSAAAGAISVASKENATAIAEATAAGAVGAIGTGDKKTAMAVAQAATAGILASASENNLDAIGLATAAANHAAQEGKLNITVVKETGSDSDSKDDKLTIGFGKKDGKVEVLQFDNTNKEPTTEVVEAADFAKIKNSASVEKHTGPPQHSAAVWKHNKVVNSGPPEVIKKSKKKDTDSASPK
jgi:hypothetical protein